MLSGLYARFILLAFTILIVSISAYVTVMLTKSFYDSIGKGASVSLSLWLLASLGLLKATEIFIEQLQRYTEKWISSQLNLRMENQLLTLLKPLVVTQIETPAFQNELPKVRSQFNSLSGTGCRTVTSCTYGKSYTHYFTRCLAVNNNYAIYCNYVKTTTGPCCSKP